MCCMIIRDFRVFVMIYISSGKLRKGNLFWTNKKFVCFFQLLKLRKIRGQNLGNELVKTSYEFVIEIKFRQIDGCDGPSV